MAQLVKVANAGHAVGLEKPAVLKAIPPLTDARNSL